MLQRFKVLLALLTINFTAIAQLNLDYGIGVNFNAPLVKGDVGSYSSLGGYGLSVNLGYTFARNTQLSNKYEFNRLSYTNNNSGFNINADNLEFHLGIRQFVPEMDSTIFSLHLIPTYSNIRGFLSSQKNQVANYNNDAVYRFDLGISLGVEIPVANNTGLELSYTHFVNTTFNDDFIDGRPNSVNLGVNIYFNKKRPKLAERELMVSKLKALQSDTLYVINRACSDSMTNELLDSIFHKYYSYSAYRIISDVEIDEIKKRGENHFYALVGRLFGGTSEPLSNGIYLLDHNFELTVYPYPVLTPYREQASRKCFSSSMLSAICVSNFNDRLLKRSSL
ncbi:MAG: outer membrane beta-barrel protein [Bacteroidia bacterium]